MAMTATAGIAVVLASVTALAALGEPADASENPCPPGGYRGECPPPPHPIDDWRPSRPEDAPPDGPHTPPPPREGPSGDPRDTPYANPLDHFGDHPPDGPGPHEGPDGRDGPPEGHDAAEEDRRRDGPAEADREPPVPRSWRRGMIALAAAQSMIGTPYSWGGGSAKGPTRGIGRGRNTVGFDCSGLVLYAWAQAGVKLAHYTGAQFRQGRRVARRNLRPGDLVFFGPPTGDPNHVGLYVGDGVMIHAPQTGDVVKKTSFVKSPHYRSRYRGAVRP